LHWAVRVARIVLLCAVAVAVGVALVSGGSGSDPRTPAALPGLPPPFLGTAVTGDGGLTAAVDAYGDVVDLRPEPTGPALIDNPSDRQAAGTVPEDTGIVPRVRIGGGAALAMWEADSVTQSYLPGTNVVRTVGRFSGARVTVTTAALGGTLAVVVDARSAGGVGTTERASVVPSVSVDVENGVRCAREGRAGHLDLICRSGRDVPPVFGAATRTVHAAAREARGWLARSSPLGATAAHGSVARGVAARRPRDARSAPKWAREMEERALLTIHALTSRRTGAVAAGARDGWAYVWPRDAATAALALEASGHGADARHVARFLTGLDLSAAARFTGTGAPVPDRAAQGDASGWATVAADATGISPPRPLLWRDRADYQESTPGTYLGNAIAATVTPSPHSGVDGPKTKAGVEFSAHQPGAVGEGRRIAGEFGSGPGLERVGGDPGSGLDSAAGWAVRPFRVPALHGEAERTLRRLVAQGTRYGITPGEGWEGGEDPWIAPTAWSAWAFAGLAAEDRSDHRRRGAKRGSSAGQSSDGRSRGTGRNRGDRRDAVAVAVSGRRDRREAIALLGDLRRAATPAGALPERVGARTGVPTSTTPLVWPSAFAVLAIRELWP
jgi:hypothetical protein